jgi:hypothetical protein
MFKNFCYAAVLYLLLAQCAGTIKVMPEYKNMNVEQSKLGIILLRESMVIQNRDDIAKNFGNGETKDVFHDFFTSQFRKFAKKDSKFGEVAVVNGCDLSGFTKSTQFLSADDSVQVSVPPQNACMGDSARFLLILDRFDISRDKKPGTRTVTRGIYGTMGITTVGASDKLVVKGTFVLWDNLAGKIVSFGKINEKTDVIVALTKQTWITAVESISSKIFVDTPYGIESVPKVE